MNTSKKLALVAAFVGILSLGGHIQPVSAQPKSQATVMRQHHSRQNQQRYHARQHHRMSQPQLRARDRKTNNDRGR